MPGYYGAVNIICVVLATYSTPAPAEFSKQGVEQVIEVAWCEEQKSVRVIQRLTMDEQQIGSDQIEFFSVVPPPPSREIRE